MVKSIEVEIHLVEEGLKSHNLSIQGKVRLEAQLRVLQMAHELSQMGASIDQDQIIAIAETGADTAWKSYLTTHPDQMLTEVFAKARNHQDKQVKTQAERLGDQFGQFLRRWKNRLMYLQERQPSATFSDLLTQFRTSGGDCQRIDDELYALLDVGTVAYQDPNSLVLDPIVTEVLGQFIPNNLKASLSIPVENSHLTKAQPDRRGRVKVGVEGLGLSIIIRPDFQRDNCYRVALGFDAHQLQRYTHDTQDTRELAN